MYRPFLVMLGVATVVRAASLFLYSPSVLQWPDAIRYLRVDPHGLFTDPWSPAGYPVFLRVMHFVSSSLVVTTAAQHVVGLIGGTFVYLTVRRIARPAWLALIPAAIPLLSGDYLFLEHILMSEALFMTLVYAGMYLAIRSHDADNPKPWLISAGVVMAASGLVRPISLVLPLVIGGWAFWVFSGSFRARLMNALSCVGSAAAVIAIYVVVATAIGPYAGINNMSGWDLYARVAPFADCTKFTPPAGTAGLCQATPPDQRPGPFYYDWVATSPGRTLFPHTPAGAKKVGAWARAALISEPVPYLKAVALDLARYVDPSVGTVRAYSGPLYVFYQFNYRNRVEEQEIGREIESRGYTGVLPVHAGGMALLEDYQTVFHIDGLPILVFLLLAIAGVIRCSGFLRQAIALLAASAILLYVVPVLTLSEDYRYGWPPAPLLCAAAVLSAYGLVLRHVRPRGATRSWSNSMPDTEDERSPTRPLRGPKDGQASSV